MPLVNYHPELIPTPTPILNPTNMNAGTEFRPDQTGPVKPVYSSVSSYLPLENRWYGHTPIRSDTSIWVYTTADTDTSTRCIGVPATYIIWPGRSLGKCSLYIMGMQTISDKPTRALRTRALSQFWDWLFAGMLEWLTVDCRYHFLLVEGVRRHLSLVVKTQYCAILVSLGGWYKVTVSLLPPLQLSPGKDCTVGAAQHLYSSYIYPLPIYIPNAMSWNEPESNLRRSGLPTLMSPAKPLFSTRLTENTVSLAIDLVYVL